VGKWLMFVRRGSVGWRLLKVEERKADEVVKICDHFLMGFQTGG
jgi:hypothetical protein